MKTSPTKRSFQVALALTLLACSGLTGCSDGQEQNASSTASSKASVVTATPKASGTPTVTATPNGSGTPSATASPTLIMTPEL